MNQSNNPRPIDLQYTWVLVGTASLRSLSDAPNLTNLSKRFLEVTNVEEGRHPAKGDSGDVE